MVYHDRDTSGLIPFRYITISEKTISNLLAENIIKGQGTKENPYEILDMDRVPDVLFFQGVYSYFQLTNGNFKRIRITKCRNISVNGCKIIYVELMFSSSLSFTHNTIQDISIKKSKGNRFQYNKLSPQAEKNLRRGQLFFPVESFVYFLIVSIGGGFGSFILFPIILGTWYYFEIMIIFLIMFLLLVGIWILFANRFLKEFWFYLKGSRTSNIISENEILAL